MLELYPEIKLVHVTAAIASGALFLLRGTAVNWGGSWGMIAPLRYLSYTIDIVLLAAAVFLLAILPAAVYSNGWLWLKLTLLVVYIGLGTLALKRGHTAGIRRGCFVAAIAIYTCMYFIARTHDPLGPVRYLLTPLR
ncbi:MAG: SirB2 family protein [Gammaproteobacteria bacterium]|jgi:uncharacterized membrane protein SirB2|nr:SirB2 family protein [Gammaproteobacteria bacterium]MDH3820856.1 SirB2 family protein [Gammaproteobacteria bacterium]MDH4006165.1 SirB2 family protein [Gammaproteobacteria bacterium]HKJ21222.1 SirB2 family protein [Woeseiaceae bacterium]